MEPVTLIVFVLIVPLAYALGGRRARHRYSADLAAARAALDLQIRRAAGAEEAEKSATRMRNALLLRPEYRNGLPAMPVRHNRDDLPSAVIADLVASGDDPALSYSGGGGEFGGAGASGGWDSGSDSGSCGGDSGGGCD